MKKNVGSQAVLRRRRIVGLLVAVAVVAAVGARRAVSPRRSYRLYRTPFSSGTRSPRIRSSGREPSRAKARST